MAADWDRLEPHTRSTDLDQGLQARIADPLWSLARQWQVGEFRGEDAASPISAQISAWINPINTFRNDAAEGEGQNKAAVEPFDAGAFAARPLEARVEAENFLAGPARVQLAGEAGLQLLRRLDAAGLASLRAKVRAAFPLELPDWCLHGLAAKEAQAQRLLARRSVDARKLAPAINKGSFVAALELDPKADAATIAALDRPTKRWLTEYRARFCLPGESGDTWADERLEYSFSLGVAAGQGEVILGAREYVGGHLDWYSFTVDADPAASHGLKAGTGGTTKVQPTVLPVPLSFPGMPASRWWEFEEGKVYFGGIQAGPADLGRLIVAEFATLYSDDWFLLPLRLPASALVRVGWIDVVDSFGGTHRVRSTAVEDQQRIGEGKARAFAGFELSGDDSVARGRTPWLLLPRPLASSIEGEALERVAFVRDEAANLAWAVEERIETSTGKPQQRRLRTSLAISEANEGADEPTAADERDGRQTWRYSLESEVPPHWIPFIPERLPDSEQVRLRRARMQGWADLPDWAVGPLGEVLDPTRPLRLHEDELPRGGVSVSRHWQLARGSDGRLHLWIGRRKRPGRGERGSGLRFDTIERG